MIAEICVSSVCLLSFSHHSYYTSQFFCLPESRKFWGIKKKKKASPKNKSPHKSNLQAQLKILCPDIWLSFARIVHATSPVFWKCWAQHPSSAVPAFFTAQSSHWAGTGHQPLLGVSWPLCLQTGWRLVSCADVTCPNLTPISNWFEYLKQIRKVVLYRASW